MQGRKFPLAITLVSGGADVVYEGNTHALRTAWRLGDILLRGTWDGESICLQIERMGLKYRVYHWGTQADGIVMTSGNRQRTRQRCPSVGCHGASCVPAGLGITPAPPAIDQLTFTTRTDPACGDAEADDDVRVWEILGKVLFPSQLRKPILPTWLPH
jgi:hypothetical protein